MKKYKLLLILIVCVTAVFASVYFYKFKIAEQTNNKVSLIITLEYGKYLLCQDIWMNTKIINNSDKDYYIDEPFDPNLLIFDVTDPERNKHCCGVVICRLLPYRKESRNG